MGKSEDGFYVSLAKAIRKSYKNERDQLDEAIKTCGYIGLSLSEFYNMSNREFTMYNYGAMKRLEDSINNEYGLCKYEAGQTALAVWGNRQYKDKTPNVDFTSSILPDSKERRLEKAQAKTLERIKRQYGVDLTQGGLSNGS